MKMILNVRHKLKGFTLIELLVVIAILVVLASILFANYVGVRQRARDGVRISDLRQMQIGLEFYRSETGYYPDVTIACPCVCGKAFTSGPDVFYDQNAIPAGVTIYMQKIPCDPSSTITTPISYVYNPSPAILSTTYTLVSCLENDKDPQRDSVASPTCASNGQQSYTLEDQ